MSDHVKRLIAPNRDGAGIDQDITLPTWTDIEEAIRSLDGHMRSDLYLHPALDDLESYLAIAGGNNNRYLVFVCHSNQAFEEATTPEAGRATVNLVVGGQLGSFALEQLVTLDHALDVARAFYDTGELAPSVTWRHR